MSQKTAKYKAVARKDMTYRQWIWKEMKKNKVAYFMIAPYLLIFTLFTITPVALSMVISFTDFNMLQWPNLVGFENYLDLFCLKSDTAKQYVQKWMPIVAASQSVKGNEKEREFLLSWVNVVDYE